MSVAASVLLGITAVKGGGRFWRHLEGTETSVAESSPSVFCFFLFPFADYFDYFKR